MLNYVHIPYSLYHNCKCNDLVNNMSNNDKYIVLLLMLILIYYYHLWKAITENDINNKKLIKIYKIIPFSYWIGLVITSVLKDEDNELF